MLTAVVKITIRLYIYASRVNGVGNAVNFDGGGLVQHKERGVAATGTSEPEGITSAPASAESHSYG